MQERIKLQFKKALKSVAKKKNQPHCWDTLALKKDSQCSLTFTSGV
jgi:hypothetical protein